MQLTKNKVIFIIGVTIFIVGIVLAVAMPNAILRSFWNPTGRLKREIPIGALVVLLGFIMIIIAGVDFWVSRWRNEEK